MATSNTQIAVSKEVRQMLYDKKQVGDTYDDVIRQLLDDGDESDNKRRIEA